MSYTESITRKFFKLLSEPNKYIPKIYPYLKSKIDPYKRDCYEFFGNTSLSKPYPDADKLYKYLSKENGFFVQVGGNDGYGFDPTYQLEKFNDWKGIIIEPLPIYKLCARNRKRSIVINTASVPFSHREKTIQFIDCNFMSFPAGKRKDSAQWIKSGEKAQKIKAQKITVPAQPLQTTIEKYNPHNKKIDLLVVDVEGYELPVLQGLDFQKNSPEFLLLEVQENKRLEETTLYLAKKNYKLTDTLSECDRLYSLNKI